MHAFSKHLAAIFLLAPGIAGAAPPAESRAEARLAKALEGRQAGRPVDCISFHSIRSTEIIDGAAILYRTWGNKLYVNRPNIAADQLRSDDIMVTKTSLSQLCRLDTVQLFERAGHFWTGFVGLGEFVPYEKVGAPR